LFNGLQESASGLYNLVEDLLEWSRAQSEDQRLQNRSFAVKALCTGILSTFKANILLKNIKLELEIPEDLNVVSDANVVGLVLRNLISNAIKFSHSGGEIRIYSENIRFEEQDYVRINVIDGGIGIHSDKLEALMQSNVHSSTDGTLQEKGSGLGLSLCLEMAPRIGARLSVVSQPGLGSTFSFDVPMV
jgi:signal transduction histidine kinase